METYRITEIKHFHDAEEYYNEFVGIPDLFNAPYQDSNAVPLGEDQPARVIDNNDPTGGGRVRVQFPWQESKGEKTPWLRVTTSYGGAARGDYKIPEIGDEVLVSFESDNAEKPYVLGAMYNGTEKSGYATADNRYKVLHSRIGNRLIMDDETGDVTLESQKGQTIAVFFGNGDIEMTAPETMTFNCKNMNINVGENMNTTVGMNSSETVGMNKTVGVGMMSMISIGTDLITNVMGKMMEYIIGNKESKVEEDRQTIINGKGVIQSSENHEFHSIKEIQHNSGENSINY